MKKIRISKSLLLSLSSGDLIDLAKQQDLFVPPNFSRQSIINELLELDIDLEDLPYKTIKMLSFEEYGELQTSYGKTEIHLLLCDPIWCFAFWDIGELEMEKIMNESGAVHFFLRVMSFEKEDDATPFAYEDIELKQEMRSLYIHASSKSDFTQVSLMYKTKNTAQPEILAKSDFVYFPLKNIQNHLSLSKTEVDEVLNLSGLQYLRQWHYNSFKLLFDDANVVPSHDYEEKYNTGV